MAYRYDICDKCQKNYKRTIAFDGNFLSEWNECQTCTSTRNWLKGLEIA